MNENEIERIAAAANALRPDWPVSSLRTLLARPELARRPRRDVAVALAWVACESTTKTPARVLEAGPWWQATNAESSGRTSYNVPCPDHAGEVLPCGRCAAIAVPASTLAAHHIANARGNLAAARRDLCSHGIRPDTCKDRHDEAETEESK